MFILDTNTLIYYFKGMGQVSRHLLEMTPKEIAIPAVVVYELEVGIAKSSHQHKRRKQLETLTQFLKVIAFDIEVAQVAAKIRAKLEKSGSPIGPMDTLIAGTTLAHHGILVTHNIQEFSQVPGLRCVDWF